MLSYLDSRGSHNVWRVKVKTWWGVKGQTITGEVPTFTISSRASGGFRASIKAPQQWLVGFGWIISFLICIVSDLVLLPAAFTVRLKQPVWDDLMFRYMCVLQAQTGGAAGCLLSTLTIYDTSPHFEEPLLFVHTDSWKHFTHRYTQKAKEKQVTVFWPNTMKISLKMLFH